ncbi:MAG: AMP-binding protein [Patescibacteria group bacterium]|jgi:phenylacetate-coenzyme A ligase PaaK-like adenylate-forming protein
MDWKTLSHLPLAEQRGLQNETIKKFFKTKLPFSPYYRDLFKKHHLEFEQIENIDDVQRIPFTTKQDIAPTPDDPGKTRQLILQPDESLIKKHSSKADLVKIIGRKLTGQDVKSKLEWEYKPIHIHFTTGRTSLPTAFGYTAYDLAALKETGQRLLNVSGADKNQFAINAFPYAPHLAFWLCAFAMQEVGMTSIQTGGGKILGTKKIIDALESTKAGIATFIPGYAYHVFRQSVHEKRNFSNLKTIVFGGERVSPGLREKVKELLRELGSYEPNIVATYAFTEGKTAWIQCHETSGYHLYPDMEFFEVIDKDGNRVPEGNPGELVFTSIGWRGTVVARYRTGDMTQGIEYRPCPHCGRTVPRIHPDIQRTSEIKEFHLTKVKGELVNLNEFYPLLSSRPDIEEWQVEIRKENNDSYGLDQLVIHIAPKANASFVDVAQRIEKIILDEMGVRALMHETSLDDLLVKLGMETEVKEKRIVDNRPKV